MPGTPTVVAPSPTRFGVSAPAVSFRIRRMPPLKVNVSDAPIVVSVAVRAPEPVSVVLQSLP